VVDVAIERFDFVDSTRLGVLGGSYGGYMTSWIIGHTDRFKAACSERACNNLFTFAHTSDIGASFPAGYIGASHLDDPDEFLRQSPVTYYRDMATPLLILHSENDLRCPIEQAEDLWLRLKMTGRDVEFVRFPGESHELSRSGAPKHRIERLELILDWFGRKL
jgi:dipeptidyl aminopeptidase/acylaminoacyl peptidase